METIEEIAVGLRLSFMKVKSTMDVTQTASGLPFGETAIPFGPMQDSKNAIAEANCLLDSYLLFLSAKRAKHVGSIEADLFE
jgi:hypothetical protein